MVSAQKEVEFHNSEYDDLKAVRSIWICMDSADDEDSINRMRLVQENVYGKEAKLDNLDKVQGVIIRLRVIQEHFSVLVAECVSALLTFSFTHSCNLPEVLHLSWSVFSN